MRFQTGIDNAILWCDEYHMSRSLGLIFERLPAYFDEFACTTRTTGTDGTWMTADWIVLSFDMF